MYHFAAKGSRLHKHGRIQYGNLVFKGTYLPTLLPRRRLYWLYIYMYSMYIRLGADDRWALGGPTLDP